MNLDQAVKKRRSIRSFQQKKVGLKILKEILNAGRLAPSGANIQPLNYLLVVKRFWRDKVFSSLRWAAYIFPQGNPEKDKKPQAYIIILVDKEREKIPAARDVGAAAENMMLTAVSRGLGSCWIGSFDQEKLSKDLKILPRYRIDSVIALGYPAEKSKVAAWQGNVKYYKDACGTMNVPKRNLKDLLLEIK